ncbi:MAG: STAS domain-containing protein [Paracoccus sp. (in: a-proteobacteria)]|nr:STAS domain-containing protein [Paracoccus sp. (in: a-proteobacteria)]
MNLSTRQLNGFLVATLEEPRLDAAISTRFKDRMREVVASGGSVILLDLSMVDFMDSSGLGAVIAARKALPEGRRIEIAGLTPNVQRVFKLTRMDSIFTIHPDLAAVVPEETQKGPS